MGTIQKILNRLMYTTLTTTIVLILIVAITPTIAKAQDLDVQIQTGPEFKDGDGAQSESCTKTTLANKFPFDFIGGSIGSGSGCPSITLFGFANELCWIVDIYLRIRPAIITSMLIYGIFNW